MERRAWPQSDGTEMQGELPLYSDRDVTVAADDVGPASPNSTASVASPRLLLSVPEAARALGITRSSLYVLIDRQELTSVSIGRRRLFPARALQEYVDGLIERSRC
jgi:excisionase family DNA binding protein